MAAWKGIPQYRCSRCDCVTFNHEAEFVDISVLNTFMSNEAVDSVQGVPRRLMHVCPDGCAGIARFCGLMSHEALENWRKGLAAARGNHAN